MPPARAADSYPSTALDHWINAGRPPTGLAPARATIDQNLCLTPTVTKRPSASYWLMS